MRNPKDYISTFFVRYLYKWILPTATTILLLLFTEKWQEGLFLRIIIWILLMVWYISIPYNFEKTNQKYIEYYERSKKIYKITAYLQVISLSVGLFFISRIACFWFIPPLKDINISCALVNSLLYAFCLANELLRIPKIIEERQM